MSDGLGVLDMHTHCFPIGLPDLAAETGDARWPSLVTSADGTGRLMRGSTVFRPVDARTWDLDARIAAMDASGVAEQVLSPVPVMLTSWADGALAARFARSVNESLAALVASNASGRFRWMGTVPLQDADRAVAELEHGVRVLGMCAVEIGTEVGGRELDDRSLFPFWAAAQDLDVAIFIHPTDGAGAIRAGGASLEFSLGMFTDTALAASALVFGGVLDAFPRLRIGLAHGCGSFAWAAPRIQRGATLGRPANETAAMRAASTELIRRLWVDALVFDEAHLPLLFERFGADHVMLGSDHPFYPPHFGDPVTMIHDAVASGFCSAAQRNAILRANAEVFLGGGRG